MGSVWLFELNGNSANSSFILKNSIHQLSYCGILRKLAKNACKNVNTRINIFAHVMIDNLSFAAFCYIVIAYLRA